MGVATRLKEYLKSEEFQKDLIRGCQRFEVLSEAGLRTAIANLLKERLDPAEDYRVSCEPRLRENVIPDVVVWKKEHPRIWIELKYTKRFDRKKAEADWAKLQKYREKYPSFWAGYLIYVARYNQGDFPIKRSRQTMRLWPIKISLKPNIKNFEQWEKEYKRRAHFRLDQAKSKRSVGATQAVSID